MTSYCEQDMSEAVKEYYKYSTLKKMCALPQQGGVQMPGHFTPRGFHYTQLSSWTPGSLIFQPRNGPVHNPL